MDAERRCRPGYPCDNKGNFMKTTARSILTAAAVLGVLLFGSPLRADQENYTLTLKDHHFAPETIEVPAGQKVKLLVRNQDDTAEEFDSYDLNREKVIAGNSEGIVIIGPLDPGTYSFTGEFHADTAHGKVVVK
jgi:plastocyanin